MKRSIELEQRVINGLISNDFRYLAEFKVSAQFF
jgi:hypothetical protein